MKRTTLMTALTAAALLLTGCTSPSGTGTSVGPSTSIGAVTASTSFSSTSSPVTQASGTTAASQPIAVMKTTSVTRTTVGNNTSGLDQRSTAWLSALCTNLGPIITSGNELSKLTGSSTPAQQQKTLRLYQTLGTTLTQAAATLKDLPAPTFNGGKAWAGEAITAFGKAGLAITAATKKLADASPTSGPAGVSNLTESLKKASAPLTDIGSYTLTEPTRADLLKIPTCASAAKVAG
jgi:hypothetical protein